MTSCWQVRHAAALQAVMYSTGQRLSPLTILLQVLDCAATKYMYSLDLITIPDCTTYSRHGQVPRAAEETITFWRAEAVQMKLRDSTCKAGVDIGHTRVNLQLKTSAANQIIYHQLHSFHLRTADSTSVCCSSVLLTRAFCCSCCKQHYSVSIVRLAAAICPNSVMHI